MKKTNSQNVQFDPELSRSEQELIQEELRILDEVLLGIVKEQGQALSSKRKYAGRMESLKEEAADLNLDDLPSLFDQLHNQWSLIESLKANNLPNLQTPYFARMVLKEPDRDHKDVLVGYMTFISKFCEYPIIDWRNAPAAKVFFNHSQGQNYRQKLPKRIANGVVFRRHVLVIDQGLLQVINTPENKFILDEKGIWTRQNAWQLPDFSGGQGQAARGSRFGTGQSKSLKEDIRGLLDENQYEILNAEDDESLLILGGAGSGKTTVALHRLSILYYRDSERFNQKSMMVLVPDLGLMKLCQNLLKNHDLHDLQVLTFDLWMYREGKRLLKGLPKKVYQDTPAAAMRLKRHPNFIKCLQIHVDNQKRQVAGIFHKAFKRIPEEELAASDGKSLQAYAQTLESYVRLNFITSKTAVKKLQGVLKKVTKIISDVVGDRETILTDRSLLQNLLCDEITEDHLEDLIRHSRNQIFAEMDIKGGGYDLSRRIALDGRDEADDHYTDTPYNSIDIEDYPLFLYLQYMKQGHSSVGKLQGGSGLEHMVLDEAQELVPIELKMIRLALSEQGTVSIAGDGVQQTKEHGKFLEWEKVLEILELGDVRTERLTTNYRSTQPIAELAHHVLGDQAPENPPESLKPGAPIQYDTFMNYGETLITIADALRELILTEKSASIAIILRNEKTARMFYAELHHLDQARLVLDGNFSFEPGIDVTCIKQVKGLEFDYVVLPDVDAFNYSDTPENRRNLHVAVTRAIHRLWIVSNQKPSPLLP